MSSLIMDGYDPGQALVLLIRERAASNSDEDEQTSDSGDIFDLVERDNNLQAYSPNSSINFKKLEEKLMMRERPSPAEVKDKLERKMSMADYVKSC